MPLSQVTNQAVFLLLSALSASVNYSYCLEQNGSEAVLQRYEVAYENLQHFAALSEFRICGNPASKHAAYYDYIAHKYVLFSSMTSIREPPADEYLAEVRRVCDLRLGMIKIGLVIDEFFAVFYDKYARDGPLGEHMALARLVATHVQTINYLYQFRALTGLATELAGNLPTITIDWNLEMQLEKLKLYYLAHIDTISTRGGLLARLCDVFRALLKTYSLPDLSDLELVSGHFYYKNGALTQLSYFLHCKSITCIGIVLGDGYACSDISGMPFGAYSYGFSASIADGIITYNGSASGAYSYTAPADYAVFSPLSVFSPHFHYNMIKGFANPRMNCDPQPCNYYLFFDSCAPLEIAPVPAILEGKTTQGGVTVDAAIESAVLHAGNTYIQLYTACSAENCVIQMPCEPEGRISVSYRGRIVEVRHKNTTCSVVKTYQCVRFVGKIRCSFDFAQPFTGHVLVIGQNVLSRNEIASYTHVEMLIDTYFAEYLFVFASAGRMQQIRLQFGDISAKDLPTLALQNVPTPKIVEINIAMPKKAVPGYTYLSDSELQKTVGLTLTLVLTCVLGLFMLFVTSLAMQCTRACANLRKAQKPDYLRDVGPLNAALNGVLDNASSASVIYK